MSSVTRPRGPLPARVYWTRRLLVTAVALVLVFGVSRLVGGGGGSGPSVRTVGDAASSATTSAAPTPTPTPTETATATAPPTTTATATSPAATDSAALAQPTGSCPASDVVATPTVKNQAYAGRPVVFAVDLSTRTTEACTWTVSARSLVLKVTSGADAVWSTQQCTGAVPQQSVVVRRAVPTSVDLAWTGQRSDSDCSRTTPWAEPGTYHAVAAAMGGEPTDLRFALLTPPRPTVTAKPKPNKAEKAAAKRAEAKASAKASATASPTDQPSRHRSAHASAGPSPSAH